MATTVAVTSAFRVMDIHLIFKIKHTETHIRTINTVEGRSLGSSSEFVRRSVFSE